MQKRSQPYIEHYHYNHHQLFHQLNSPRPDSLMVPLRLKGDTFASS